MLGAGCSSIGNTSDTDGTLGLGGQGGVKSSGGSVGSDGEAGSGGSAANAGRAGTGGDVSTGGSAASGGSVATGGSSGGSVGTGGSAGGQSTDGGSGSGGGGGSGGGARVGGMTGASGVSTGTGGAQMQPFKGIAGGACKVRTAMNVSWYYNWEGSEDEACAVADGVEYVPMVWGADTAAKIETAVAGFASKGYQNVLGFNEPDNTTQSNITVASAIALLPAFDGAKIAVGTPATQANATGQAWFTTYMADVAASTTLRADFIAIHWYGWNAGSCDAAASQLESYIKYAEAFPGNRPIWLTEWGCLNQSAPTAAGVIAFFQGALAVFAKHPRLARYAWYQWSANCEVYNTDDTLTALGQVYAAAPAKH